MFFLIHVLCKMLFFCILQMHKNTKGFIYEREVFMKLCKKILSLAMVLCLSLATTTIAFAAETNSVAEQVDYLNYDFPDDAVVLYQSEDGVVYQSNEVTPWTTYHNSKTITGGRYEQSSFSITNPHTIINTTNGTFRVESDYSGAAADMLLSDGANILTNQVAVKPSNGDAVITNKKIFLRKLRFLIGINLLFFVIQQYQRFH